MLILMAGTLLRIPLSASHILIGAVTGGRVDQESLGEYWENKENHLRVGYYFSHYDAYLCNYLFTCFRVLVECAYDIILRKSAVFSHSSAADSKALKNSTRSKGSARQD